MPDFVHLHTHTQYSILDSCCRIEELAKAAEADQMPALAITDYNMFGVPEFFSVLKSRKIKPVIGLEAYITSDRLAKNKLNYHLVLFAQDQAGYQNLMQLASIAYLDGFYYKPRIDRAILRKYAQGLIATSSCLKGEIPQRLIYGAYEEALALAKEYMEIFEGRFYIEIQRHGISAERKINRGLVRIAKDLNLPVIATNDIHYMNNGDADAHEVLLGIQSSKTIHDTTLPKYPNDTFYFRSSQEMKKLFRDIPEAIENTLRLAEQCTFALEFGKTQLPTYHLPGDFTDENEYLKHLAYEGIEIKFNSDVTKEMYDRLDYELSVIKKMGFPGYFLVVQDFINSAKSMGVSVGPGRGSAAGSLVSYAIGITNVDPLKYDLLFERFLNPERISMPDIDIDFDDRGRGKVIEYVINKYGKDNVAQVITFGTMAARAVIRDVARVLDVPLNEADRIAKLVPRKLGTTLKDAIGQVPEFSTMLNDKDENKQKLIKFSQKLEGLVRQPGIHAAGVVITPKPTRELIPIYKSGKDEISTQYDKDWLEKIGILKMDFLGLTTLTILDDAVRHIEKNHGIIIDLDHIPLDDKKVFDLFARGDTVGIFQFESQGMTEYMKQLRPTSIEDLIAMNALYRPGPMQFIPNYIARKHGREDVEYYHPDLEPLLKSTYGVIVYQEQVMQIARLLAGFSMGKADNVRRMMAKKKPEELEKLKPEWKEGVVKQGYSEALADEIYKVLEPFSEYAFNKSHSAAYSLLAYQTAYIKAYYPVEFMAAALSSEMANTDRIAVLINACKDMGINVLPPDVNESEAEFLIKENSIRFGLAAVKNIGYGAIESIVQARKEHAPFRSLLDLCRYVDLRTVNKKVLESLIMSGACDSLAGHRAQKFEAIEQALNLGSKIQEKENSSQEDIFGKTIDNNDMFGPVLQLHLSEIPSWTRSEELAREKELMGFYASGHPLDKYRFEIEALSTYHPGDKSHPKEGSELRIGGMIGEIRQITDKKGQPMAFITIQGYSGNLETVVFSSIMKDYSLKIIKDSVVILVGKASYRNETLSMIADKIFTVEEALENFTKSILIHAPIDQLTNGNINRLRELFIKYHQPNRKMSCEIQLIIDLPDIQSEAHYKIDKFMIPPSKPFIQDIQNLLGHDRVKVVIQ
jgi:DNA polymerase III subunit alpha